MKTFQSIKYWIFDLDNTLYSAKTKVFDQVEKKMAEYVSDKLNTIMDEARKIQNVLCKHLFFLFCSIYKQLDQ